MTLRRVDKRRLRKRFAVPDSINAAGGAPHLQLLTSVLSAPIIGLPRFGPDFFSFGVERVHADFRHCPCWR